jgi:hypothetical protein
MSVRLVPGPGLLHIHKNMTLCGREGENGVLLPLVLTATAKIRAGILGQKSKSLCGQEAAPWISDQNFNV